MHPSRVATALLLPLGCAAHYLGYYATRSVQWQLGSSVNADMVTASGLQGGAALAGAVVGMLFSVAIGGAFTAALGILGCVVAYFMLPFASEFSFTPVVSALGFTQGMVRVGCIAAVARAFGRGHSMARVAAFSALYASVSVASMLSGPVSGQLSGLMGPSTVTVFAAFIGVVALLAVIGVGVVQLAKPAEADIDSALAWQPASLGIAAGVTLLGALTMGAWTLGADMQWRAMDAYSMDAWVMMVNPVTVALAGLAMVVLYSILAAMQVRVPLLAPGGLGVLLIAAGLLPSALGKVGGGELIIGLSVISALGEVLFYGPVAARVVGEQHWRLAGVTGGLFVLASTLAGNLNMVMSRLGGGGEDMAGWSASALALGLGVLGLVFLALAWPLHAVDVKMEAEANRDADDDAPAAADA